MQFIFLGTGTSAGVPAIGMDPPTDDPRDRRLRTSACFRFTDHRGRPRTVLIDCGPDIRQQALAHGLDRCDAILFTHNHVDHTWGLDEVRRFNVLQGGPIDIYAEEPTLRHLRRVYQHVFERHKNVQDSFVASIIPHRVHIPDAEGDGGGGALLPDRLDLFGLLATPFRLLHGRLPIAGWRFEPADNAAGRHLAGAAPDGLFPLAWCTDVSAVPPRSWGMLGGLGTLCLDALRRRHHPTHLTLDQALAVVDRAGPKRAFFIHMGGDLPHEATNAEIAAAGYPHVRLAHDGLTLGRLPAEERAPTASEAGW